MDRWNSFDTDIPELDKRIEKLEGSWKEFNLKARENCLAELKAEKKKSAWVRLGGKRYRVTFNYQWGMTIKLETGKWIVGGTHEYHYHPSWSADESIELLYVSDYSDWNFGDALWHDIRELYRDNPEYILERDKQDYADSVYNGYLTEGYFWDRFPEGFLDSIPKKARKLLETEIKEYVYNKAKSAFDTLTTEIKDGTVDEDYLPEKSLTN